MGSSKLWTPANKVTLIRILAIPLFVAIAVSPWPNYVPEWPDAHLWKPTIAALVFVVISATDALDGHLARSRNEVTTLGKFLDPLADKILVTAALLVLIEQSVLPSWVALIIIAREFIVSGIRMVAASEGVVIAASMWGKVKTVTQIVAIVLFLIKGTPLFGDFSQDFSEGLYVLSWATMLVALAFTIISMLDYFSKARDLLGFTKRADKIDVERFDYMSMRERAEKSEVAAPTHAEMVDLGAKVVAAAREKRASIATAESCTGGLISAVLTAVPGSSDVVAGGIVSYSNRVKSEQLGVSATTLDEHGAVSRETACAMVRGVCERLGVGCAVAVTGIAGPGGATPDKPVGTVWIAWMYGDSVDAECFLFPGDRQDVRYLTTARALNKLLELLQSQSASSKRL